MKVRTDKFVKDSRGWGQGSFGTKSFSYEHSSEDRFTTRMIALTLVKLQTFRLRYRAFRHIS